MTKRRHWSVTLAALIDKKVAGETKEFSVRKYKQAIEIIYAVKQCTLSEERSEWRYQSLLKPEAYKAKNIR